MAVCRKSSCRCEICGKPGHQSVQCLEIQAKTYSEHLAATCPVCREGKCEYRLECGHYIHYGCVQEWYLRKSDISYAPPDCPICRKPLALMKTAKRRRFKGAPATLVDFDRAISFRAGKLFGYPGISGNLL